MSVAPAVSEKSLPAAPGQPHISPAELQEAIDRIQEMYGLIRDMQMQTQSSASNAGANERVVELQRQIEHLMADNAVLSGEQPPDYYDERRDSGRGTSSSYGTYSSERSSE
jgi:hypothetical protein